MYIHVDIGHNIKILRLSRSNLRQGDFAKKVGITPTYMSMIEGSKNDPSLKTLVKIAIELDVPLASLFKI